MKIETDYCGAPLICAYGVQLLAVNSVPGVTFAQALLCSCMSAVPFANLYWMAWMCGKLFA